MKYLGHRMMALLDRINLEYGGTAPSRRRAYLLLDDHAEGVLRRAEARGFVESLPPTGPRNAKPVQITPKGYAALSEYFEEN